MPADIHSVCGLPVLLMRGHDMEPFYVHADTLLEKCPPEDDWENEK